MKTNYSYSYLNKSNDNFSEEEPTNEGSEIMVWGSNKFGQLGIGEKIAGIDFPKVNNQSKVFLSQ